MAIPTPGPFSQGNTMFTDPISVALGQSRSTLLEGEQQANEAVRQQIMQAIGGLQQANQQDTAPTTDSPFPMGGLKGALFGVLAGMGGLGPQFSQQLGQINAQNAQQEGFLKLREMERQKQISGLQMKGAELDADYQKYRAQLDSATDIEQAKLAQAKMDRVLQAKKDREAMLSREQEQNWQNLQGVLDEAMITGQFGGGSLADPRVFELAKSAIERRLQSISPELRGDFLAQAMGALSAGREFAMLNQPQPAPPSDKTPIDMTNLGTASQSIFQRGAEELGPALEWLIPGHGRETAEIWGNALSTPIGEAIGSTELPPAIDRILQMTGAYDELNKGPAEHMGDVASAIFGGPINFVMDALSTQPAPPPKIPIDSPIPGELVAGLRRAAEQRVRGTGPLGRTGNPVFNMGQRAEEESGFQTLDKGDRDTVREIRQFASIWSGMSSYNESGHWDAPIIGRDRAQRKHKELAKKLIALRAKLGRDGVDDGYLRALLGEAYDWIIGGPDN